jgi:hypothetical protein
MRAALAVAVVLTAARAAAQASGGCDGKIISAVVIHPRPPSAGDLPGIIGSAVRTASAVHSVTRPRVIDAFLALHAGDVCTELRRAESERILRDLPFIVSATITVTSDDRGLVRLDVYTIDETSLLLNANVQGASPYFTRALLGDGNLAGQGVLAEGDWRDGFAYRDHFGAQITDYALFGEPLGLSLQGSRDELGGSWHATLVRPFYSDLQKFGWLVDAGETRLYIPFLGPTSLDPVDLDYSRHWDQVGGIIRLGRPGHLTLYGVTLSQEREESGAVPVIVTDSGLRRDSTDTFAAQYSQHQIARLNVLWGIREIHYRLARGFDALTGAQDIATGVQFGTLVGHSLSLIGARDTDLFVASTLYAGAGNGKSFVGFQANGEGREDLSTSGWDGVLTSGRLAWYYKPLPDQTVILSSEFGIGLQQRLPFALWLGDPDGGVRGYSSARVVGGARTVARVEEHWSWGTFHHFADLGLATFVDAGRMWAENVPYGVNTGMVYGAGFGLLAAVPPQSKRLLRVDFAVPLTHEPYARFEIRFSTTDRTQAFYVAPRDVARAQEQIVPTSIFQFPSE